MQLFSFSLYRVRPYALAILLSATSLTPALAEDCFPNAAEPHAIPVAFPPHHAPARAHVRAHVRRVHHVHHATPAHRAHRVHYAPHHAKPHGVKRIKAKAVRPKAPSHRQWLESSLAKQTIPTYVAHPTSCDLRPASLLRSAAPAVELPAAQRLLDEMVGPPSATVASTETAPGGLPPGDSPRSFFTPPFDDTGGTPATSGKPGGPTGGGPTGGTPGTPGTPGKPVGAVPEPATWAVMLLGFFAVGGALRAGRASKRKAEADRPT